MTVIYYVQFLRVIFETAVIILGTLVLFMYNQIKTSELQQAKELQQAREVHQANKLLQENHRKAQRNRSDIEHKMLRTEVSLLLHTILEREKKITEEIERKEKIAAHKRSILEQKKCKSENVEGKEKIAVIKRPRLKISTSIGTRKPFL